MRILECKWRSPAIHLALAIAIVGAGGCKRRGRGKVQDKEPQPQPQPQPQPEGEPPRLSSLELYDEGGARIDRLAPVFDSKTTQYRTEVGFGLQKVLVKASPATSAASVQVNGLSVVAGTSSQPIVLDVGRTRISAVVTAPSGSKTTYVLEVDRGRSVKRRARVEPSPPVHKAGFGSSIALWGDTLAVVAAAEEVVYVFRVRSGKWRQEARLRPAKAKPGREFGASIALWGDTLAVGAPDIGEADAKQPNNNRAAPGAVYLFTRAGGTWRPQGVLEVSEVKVGDGFGGSVALWGDTLAVGAPYKTTVHDLNEAYTPGEEPYSGKDRYKKVADSGVVYVFVHKAGKWTRQARLEGNECASHELGSAVALWGDTLVASAPGDDSAIKGVHDDHPINEPDPEEPDPDSPDGTIVEPCPDHQRPKQADRAGAVYVFTRSGSRWGKDAYVKPSNPDALDEFGGSVALWGDTLVVGAPNEGSNGKKQGDNSARGAGAVYVFMRGKKAWRQRGYLKASRVSAGDGFGASLALWGRTLAVRGSPPLSVGPKQGVSSPVDASSRRKAYVHVFTRKGSRWRSRTRLASSSAKKRTGDFNLSVALWGDTFAVAGAGSKAVYVFR